MRYPVRSHEANAIVMEVIEDALPNGCLCGDDITQQVKEDIERNLFYLVANAHAAIVEWWNLKFYDDCITVEYNFKRSTTGGSRYGVLTAAVCSVGFVGAAARRGEHVSVGQRQKGGAKTAEQKVADYDRAMKGL